MGSKNFKQTIYCFLCLLFPLLGFSQENDLKETDKQYYYQLSIDHHFSSKSSGDLALSVFEGYRQLEENFISTKPTGFSRLLTSSTRFIVAQWISIVNHEMGGHGAQLRKLGIGASYRINLFSGATHFSSRPKNHHDSTMITLGGMHASELLSEFTKNRLLKNNNIDPNLGVFYFANKLGQIVYIFSCKADHGKNGKGHDVSCYIKEVNSAYQTDHLTALKLKKYSCWGLLDPLSFYSIHSWSENKLLALPLIPVKISGLVEPIGYLPSAKLLLSPYGPELEIQNLFKISDRFFELTLLYGRNQKIKSYGIALKSNHWLDYQKFTIGGELYLWSQPELLTAGDFTQATMKTGGLLKVNTRYSLNKTFDFYFDAGYKTAGFVLGESLKKGAILKAGVGINW